jgi:hypothetical protein
MKFFEFDLSDLDGGNDSKSLLILEIIGGIFGGETSYAFFLIA